MGISRDLTARQLAGQPDGSAGAMTDQRMAISVPEAAAELGLSRNGAYEAVKRGEIPAVRIGRRLFVPRDAISKMLEQAQVRARAV